MPGIIERRLTIACAEPFRLAQADPRLTNYRRWRKIAQIVTRGFQMAAFRDMPIHLAGRRLERALAAGYSRAQFMRRAAIAAGGAAGYGLLAPQLARAADSAPRPIPGGFAEDFSIVPSDPFIHVLPPAVGFEMSTITDFNGVIAAGEIRGTAHGSDGSSFTFDADMRFMRGVYVSMDGRRREGSFGFV